jgi:hypothetical protein
MVRWRGLRVSLAGSCDRAGALGPRRGAILDRPPLGRIAGGVMRRRRVDMIELPWWLAEEMQCHGCAQWL